MKPKTLLQSGLAALLLLALTPAWSQQMNYQGRLTDANGNPLADGQHTITFSLWDAASGGTQIWGPYTTDGTPGNGHGPFAMIVNGRFNTVLGPLDAASRPLNTAFNGDRWLQIQVAANTPIQPRQKLLAAPLAMKADIATTVPDNAITTAKIADGAITQNKLAGNIGSTLTGVAKLAGDNSFSGNQNVTGSVIVDFNSINNGSVFGSPALVFGGASSGEGIASKRTAGGNQFGLDFYTGYASRMSISSSGLTVANANISSGLTAGNANIGSIRVGPDSTSLGEKRVRFGDSDNVYVGESETVNDVLVLRGNRGVRILSNTTASIPLTVLGSAAIGGDYFYLANNGSLTGTGGFSSTESLSIKADAGVQAFNMVLRSDRRMKTIDGPTDHSTDLNTLLGIEITDYHFKDTIGKGGRPQKKVIAQQVEQIFPQAVSQGTDVIPDIYKQAPCHEGWIEIATDLKAGERVKLITEKEGEKIEEVLEVAAGKFRTAPLGAGIDKVFVYGREVNDFRSVDYNAISMLNVSATQELARQVKEKDAKIAALEDRLAALEKSVAILAAAEAPGGPVRKETAGR